jgi:hypothetical protein
MDQTAAACFYSAAHVQVPSVRQREHCTRGLLDSEKWGVVGATPDQIRHICCTSSIRHVTFVAPHRLTRHRNDNDTQQLGRCVCVWHAWRGEIGREREGFRPMPPMCRCIFRKWHVNTRELIGIRIRKYTGIIPALIRKCAGINWHYRGGFAAIRDMKEFDFHIGVFFANGHVNALELISIFNIFDIFDIFDILRNSA